MLPLTRRLIFLLPLCGYAASSAACTVSGAFGYLGHDSIYGMVVKPGEACGHTFTLRGGADALEGVSVVTRPRFGKAGNSGASSIAYQAPVGYTGSDSFVVEMKGTFRGAPATTRIQFKVDVVP